MRISIVIVALLFAALTAHAQYPSNPNKIRLGYQTTGDGLVFRGSGAPAYTPGGIINAWVYLDTVGNSIYQYQGGAWRQVASVAEPDSLEYASTTQELSIKNSNTVNLVMNTDLTLLGSNTVAQPLRVDTALIPTRRLVDSLLLDHVKGSGTSGKLAIWNGTKTITEIPVGEGLAIRNDSLVNTGTTAGTGTNLTFSGASSPVTLASDTGTDVVFTAGTNISFSQTGNNLTITNTFTEVDGSTSNELQNLSFSGASSPVTLDISAGTDVIFAAGSNITLSQSGNTLTIAAASAAGTDLTFSGAGPYTLNSSTGTDVTFTAGSGITITRATNDLSFAAADASATNELQTLSTLTNTVTLSNSGGSFTIAGAGINVASTAGSTITITGTEVDGSTTNEIQTLAFSGASSPVTLDISGTASDVIFAAGTGISLSQSAGTLTIASTSTGSTNLTFSGASSPVTLASDTGTDVVFTAGTNISFSQTGNNLTINNTFSEVDGSTTNEIQTLAFSGTTSPVTLDISGTASDVTFTAGTNISLSATSGNITITNTFSEVDGSTSNELQNLSFSGASSPVTLNISSGTGVTLAAGTNVTLAQSGNTLTINASGGTDGNGIYSGSGSLPSDVLITGSTYSMSLSTNSADTAFTVHNWGAGGGFTAFSNSGTAVEGNTNNGGYAIKSHSTGSSTNSMGQALKVGYYTTGTAAADIGSAIVFWSEDGSGNEDYLGQIGFRFSDVTNTSEDSQFEIYTRAAGGGMTRRVLVANDGAITLDAYNSTNQTGTPTYYLGTDANGKIVKTSSAGGGANLTFSGASSPVTLLSDSGTDVTFTAGTNVTFSQTGNNLTINASGAADGNGIYSGSGSLSGNTTITGSTNYLWLNTASTNASGAFRVAHTGASGTAVYATASSGGIGAQIEGTTSYGAVISATSGRAIYATNTDVSSVAPIWVDAKRTGTGSAHEVLRLDKTLSSGSGVAGIGVTEGYYATNGSGFQTQIGSLGMKFTTTTNTSEVGSFELTLVNSGALGRKILVGGDGAVTLDGYSGTLQTGTPTYFLGTDVNGKIVKATSGGDGNGIYSGSGTIPSTVTVTIPANRAIDFSAASTDTAMTVKNTSGGGLYAVATNAVAIEGEGLSSGTGIYGKSTSGYGVTGWTSSGIGLSVSATSGKVAEFNKFNADGITLAPVLTLNAFNVAGSGGTGLGPTIEFYGEEAGANLEIMGRMAFKYTDATNTSEDAAFELYLRTAGAGASTRKLFIESDGAVTFDAYSGAAMTGTPTYYLGTDANGKIVKTSSAGGGANLTFSGASSPVTLLSDSGTDVVFAAGTNVTLSQSGNTLTINASGGGSTNLAFSGASSPVTLTSDTGNDVTFTAGTNISLSATSGNITINNTFSEVDGSVSNEGSLTVGAGTASTSLIQSNTSGSTAVTLEAGANITLTETGSTITIAASSGTGTDLTFSGASSPYTLNSSSGSDVTITAGSGITITRATNDLSFAAVDASTTNEIQTLAFSGTTSPVTLDISGTASDVIFAAGSNVTLSQSGGTLTISASTGGGSNLAFSGASSPVTLTSDSGTDVVFTAGTNVTFSQTGNNLTINASGGGSTNLAFSGATSPVTLTSDTGNDVIFAAGTGISLSQSTGTLTITNTFSEVDGSITNEGSLTVGVGTGTTSIINSNTSGSTGVTLTAAGALSISESGNVITLTATEVDGSTSNEIQTLAFTGTTSPVTLDISGTASDVTFTAGSNVTLSATSGNITISASTGGGSNLTFSGASSPVTLASDSGTDVVFTAGTNVTFSQTGNNLTINASGGGSTNLGFTGATSPVTLTSDTGNDVTFAAGTGISLSQSAGTLTIANTFSEVDGSVSNEGSLTVGAGTASTSLIQSNTSGSTAVTLEAGANITLTETGSTITIAATSGSGTDLTFSGAASPYTLNSSTGTDVTFTAGSGITITRATNDLSFAAADASATNEIQTLAFSGASSPVTLDISSSASDVIFAAGTNISLSQSAGTLTINNTFSEVDGSTTNEIQTLAFSGASSPVTLDISGTASDVIFAAGTGISLSQSAGTLTITSTAGATDLTFSGAASPYTLNSSTGTDVTFTAGSGITITRATNDLSFAAADASATNEIQTLAFSGASSPVTLDISSSASDVIFAAGTGISLSQSAGTLTIANTFSEVDGSITNEGSLTVGVGTGTTSIINSNTSGSTGVTLTAAGALSISESGNVITLTATEVDGSTSNELQNLSLSGASSPVTLNISSGTGVTLTAGTNVTFSQSANNLTINAAGGTDGNGIYSGSGSLSGNTTVTQGATNTLTFTSSYAGAPSFNIDNSNAGTALEVTTTGAGTAILGITSTGIGLYGQATGAGTGVYGTATGNGYAFYGSAATGVGIEVQNFGAGALSAAYFTSNTALTNAEHEVLKIQHGTSGTAAAGFGTNIGVWAENGSGTQRQIGRLGFDFTTVTNTSEASQFELSLINSGTVARKMLVGADGKVTLDGYTSTSQTGTPTYFLGTDANGVVMKQGLNTAKNTTLYSATTTAEKFNITLMDCSAAVRTVNPPSSPAAGDRFAVSDAKGASGTNNITIDFVTATQKLYGSVQNYILNRNGAFVEFVYIDSTIGWVATK